ncbi:chromo domain-containing protein LHP1 [Cannabis sativa]|uniref:Chromo domain-containing protein n=1 Tax=Cannabis sativa TaxID=3483 RepID=A0A803RCH8_CANSA|nr:chromo domain-containing protein LHP1 [Cannabis sativa]
MKVKGGGKKKGSCDTNLGGDSDTNPPPNGSLSSQLDPSLFPLSLQQQDTHLKLHDAQPQPHPDVHDAENNEEDDDEDEDDADNDDANENTERPKLDDGFYEIEAIRRKRVRKGQLQYLIKWRGWPETANTWEPLENLQSCSDVIELFEESLQSGKHRKRKRKHGTPHSQPKKRQQRPTGAHFNGTALETTDMMEKSTAALDNLSLAEISALPQEEYLGDVIVNNGETFKKFNVENGVTNAYPKKCGRKDENEYDPKLSELKTTSTSNADKLGVQHQEPKSSEGNGPTEGIPQVHCAETVQNNRSMGAKRRKSGSVKRFKQELPLCDAPVIQNITIGTSILPGSRIELLGTGSLTAAGENPSDNNRADEYENSLCITKIIKPIGYSASVTNNIQDVSVTFMAMRSDGREVMVDNKFLKANNPHLLINFYEQHLRYTATL